MNKKVNKKNNKKVKGEMLKRSNFILRDLGGISLGVIPLDPLIITSIDLGQPIQCTLNQNFMPLKEKKKKFFLKYNIYFFKKN